MTNLNKGPAGYYIDVENAEEMDRLIQQARLISEHVGLLPAQIALAPDQVVLDIGCGPGEWALEMAQKHPACQIMGIDLSQRLVTYANASARVRQLSNAVFRVANACEPLPFSDAFFDVVHARFVTGFLQVDTWPVFLKECFRILRPGGMMCSTEFESFGITTSSALTRYNDSIVAYLRRGKHCFTQDGPNVGVMAVQASLLRQSGFTSIQQAMHVLNYSFGSPAHERMVEDYSALMRLIQPALVQEEKMSQEELNHLYTQAMIDAYASDFCAVTMFQTVWGEKPV